MTRGYTADIIDQKEIIKTVQDFNLMPSAPIVWGAGQEMVQN